MKDLFEMSIEFISMQSDRSLQRIATEMNLTTEDLKRKIQSRSLDSNELLDFVRCSRSEQLLEGVLDRLRPRPSAGKIRTANAASSTRDSENRKRRLN